MPEQSPEESRQHFYFQFKKLLVFFLLKKSENKQIISIHSIQNKISKRKIIMQLDNRRILLLIQSLLVLAGLKLEVEAHQTGASYYNSNPLPARADWMRFLPNNVEIRRMSIPGTHDSGAYKVRFAMDNLGFQSVITQRLDLKNQLEAGIRFLDIRIGHIGGEFRIYHIATDLDQNFDQVLATLNDFLFRHPDETVLMRVQMERKENEQGTFESVFLGYYGKYKDRFANYFDGDSPTLGQVRGKIVLLQEFAASKYYGLKYHSFRIQDDFYIPTAFQMYDKWQAIKKSLEEAARDQVSRISYLSANGGVTPLFAATGHMSEATGGDHLSTGLTTPAFNHMFPEYPRWSCFLGMCSIYYEGQNILARDYLVQNPNAYCGIVVADFPGASLINTIIDRNPKEIIKDSLEIGEKLFPKQFLMSQDRRWRAVYQDDGSFVIRDAEHWWRWGVHPVPSVAPGHLIMQADGNVVAYDSNGRPYWATNTWQSKGPNFRLIMQNDRNLVLYKDKTKPIWASNSQQRKKRSVVGGGEEEAEDNNNSTIISAVKIKIN